MTERDYSDIVEWLYRHDGIYRDKHEWRSNFIEFLYELVDDEIVCEFELPGHDEVMEKLENLTPKKK